MTAPQTIPSVHKAISVLEFISESREAVSVKELIYSLDISPASCYRIVRTLVGHNFLREDPSGGLRIGFGAAKLARAYSEVEVAVHKLRAPLQHLASTLQLSAKISLREGEWAVTLLRAEPPRPNANTSPVGQRIHLAQGGSVAAALLSTLSDVEIEGILSTAPDGAWLRQKPDDVLKRARSFRKKGVSTNLGIQHPSIYAMSMLVCLTPTENVAVSVVGWPEDFQPEKLDSITQKLGECVEQMNTLCNA
ncbi:MAG: helix-turn-helix domain-containing protein [Kiritimatiellae bacterium]|jgi:DNA-binding IclR family transcriptional regulator|nr:helix-turn-helix domain-containing protein [Kiritimatiellia bacterium]